MQHPLPWTPTLALACAHACACLAGNWPQWRGPEGSGVAPDSRVPLTWDATNHVRWKTPIPGRGHSSPIVWQDRLYLTTDLEGDPIEGARAPVHRIEGQDFKHPESIGADRHHTLQVLCLNTSDGRIRWTQTVHQGRVFDDRHRKGSYAAPTCATDGRHVVSWFGAEGLYCHDPDGRLLWKRSLGPLSTLGMGPGASPVLHSGRIFLQCDLLEGADSFIAALDLATGAELWRQPRKVSAGWSTPITHVLDGQALLVASGAETLTAYRAADGAVVWYATGLTNNAIPSPVRWHSTAIFTAGYPRKRVLALDLTPAADPAQPKTPLWDYDRGTAYVPSPIVLNDLLYLVTDSGMLTCLEPATGRVVYDAARLPVPASVTASPIAVRDRILLTAEDGRTFVVVAGREHRIESINPIGESVMASAAVAGDRLYLRGEHHLFAIGEP